MEIIIWFIVLVVVGGLTGVALGRYPYVLQHFRQKRNKPLPVLQKTLAQVHAEDHAWWEAQARELLQANCSHVYHHQKWYTCINCGQEEPWEYKSNCSCRYETVTTLVGPVEMIVTERSSGCVAHGTDYTYWPLSERKQGPYAYNNDRSGLMSLKRTTDLQGKLNVRKIRYEEFTVSPM